MKRRDMRSSGLVNILPLVSFEMVLTGFTATPG